MSDRGVIQDEISKRYGGVLFDLAQEIKLTSTISKEANLILKNLEELGAKWNFVLRPVVPLSLQRQVVEQLGKDLKLSLLMQHFLSILCQNRKLPALRAVLDDFIKRTEMSVGMIEGTLETTTKLTPSQVKELTKTLEKQMGKSITLTQKIKEDLLGGVVIKLGSLMIDASLRSQLSRIRQGMKG